MESIGKTPIYKSKTSSLDDTDEDYCSKGKNCPLCKRHFSVFRPKHRCRICGIKVCDECSRNKVKLAEGKRRGSRTCDTCASLHINRMHLQPSYKGNIFKDDQVFDRNLSKKMNRITYLPLKHQKSFLRNRHLFSAYFLGIILILRLFISGKTSSNTSFHSFIYLLHHITSLYAFSIGFITLIFIDEVSRFSHLFLLSSKKTEINECKEIIEKSSSSEEDGGDIPADTGDQHLDDSPFCAEYLITVLKDCHKDLDNISLDNYLKVCREITKLIGSLGKGISFAASTVAGYISISESTVDSWPLKDTANGDICNIKSYTIQDIIDREINLGIADVGGKKNPSVCRCILRLLWFIDFVESLVRYCLIESTQDDVSSGAIQAYEETIGSRHPWIIRKGVNAALSVALSRESFLRSLKVKNSEGEISEKVALELVLIAHKLIVGLQENLHKKLSANHLSNIK